MESVENKDVENMEISSTDTNVIEKEVHGTEDGTTIDKKATSFKMPMIIPSKQIKTKSALFKSPQEPNIVKPKDSPVIETPVVAETPLTEKRASNKPLKEIPPLPYKEPKWGGKPDKEFSFEVLKNGKIISTIDLTKESYYVFGRLESCNIVFEHPSVSRYHAVLQYRAEGDKDHESGFYLYDLESTHGTFLNKNQLRPRTYYRVRVGHLIKIGGSSRIHIMQGPVEDEEEESELTVTEIKDLAKKKHEEMKLKAEMLEKGGDDVPTSEVGKKDDTGIDWGFGEDAVDEPIGDNPFTLAAEIAPNEDLYINDPKKTIRGWFEREGYELEYKVEEKGVAHFTCRIELPIDPTYCQTYFAEATVKGKKKEAVIACALEACRILDRHGLLRQSHQESRKRKKKNWEGEDFYDSDEDTFLDRTGTIEKKREMRKKMVTNEVETYDTLMEKLEKLENEMKEINKLLQESSKKAPVMNKDNNDEDSLEAYMAAITKANEVDKTKKSRLRLELSNLQKEKLKLVKLVNLARPTSLPPLTLPKETKKTLPMTGSMKGFKPKTSLAKVKPKITAPEIKIDKRKEDDDKVREEEDDFVEEEEDEKEDVVEGKSDKVNEKSSIDQREEEEVASSKDDESSDKMDETETPVNKDHKIGHENAPKTHDEPEKVKVIGPVIPKDVNVTLPVDEDSEMISEKLNEDQTNPLNRKRNTERMERRKRAKKGTGGYDPSDPNYAIWLPPENQTGDGKTHLNDKYGY